LSKFGVTNGFKTKEPMAFEITDFNDGVSYLNTCAPVTEERIKREK